MIATKFVGWDIPALESLRASRTFILRDKLNRGEKINREDKNWITKEVNSNAYFKRAIPVQGWKFDFSDILRGYVVKQYGHWSEYYATDKTALRSFLSGRIEKIVEQ